MSVEPFFTGTAAAASIVLPPILMRGFRFGGGAAFLCSIVLANIVSEIVFRAVKPEFHYGPLYGLGIVMNVVITVFLAGFAVALTPVITRRIEVQK
ncbi:MAG: hypothetical protein K2W81_10920 [Sphingomonas sp.]|uniref:hypothetical protein n=1 Tax=Sphingomonas sp. TaxID=28214 RepID=UPI0025DBFD0C|nr:hypothetical protein [Sphingomonas sp.]MBY0284461.1 hypothetical protein [Sphingomonas sp.]